LGYGKNCQEDREEGCKKRSQGFKEKAHSTGQHHRDYSPEEKVEIQWLTPRSNARKLTFRPALQ